MYIRLVQSHSIVIYSRNIHIPEPICGVNERSLAKYFLLSINRANFCLPTWVWPLQYGEVDKNEKKVVTFQQLLIPKYHLLIMYIKLQGAQWTSKKYKWQWHQKFRWLQRKWWKKHKLLVMIHLGFKFPKLIIKKVVLSQFCKTWRRNKVRLTALCLLWDAPFSLLTTLPTSTFKINHVKLE